jgi:hypothetical protein
MNFNFPETIEKKLSTGQEKNDKILQSAENFLGEEKKYFSKNDFEKIISETELEKNKIEREIYESENKNSKNTFVIDYDSYQGQFKIEKQGQIEKKLSAGIIIGAQRWGFNFCLSDNLKKFTKVSDLKNIGNVSALLLESKIKKFLFSNLNKNLAQNMSEKIRQQDLLKAQAYEEIANRSGSKNEQLGVRAEQIILGVLESIAIDRPDLGFDVLEANAYQDVNDKIDFIIDTKHKKRGVGVESTENSDIFQGKSIGIQFTINEKKAEQKLDQIMKAKERGLKVDDIIYVQIEQKVLQEAIREWKKSGKNISGPWKFLSPEIRVATLTNLFKDILSEEQIKSLTKNMK